ncbi:MAG: hypothetical protein J5593_04020 [Bacteroidaceae bacterium]|nr:hypothetical protein [Bacteroidaceae bacterium]
MKKLFLALVLAPALTFAQDLYQVAELSATDLNGTARYVGMGGAMSSLGGDLSVMSSNPAAIGLYRRSDVAATASLVTMPGSHKFDGDKPTYVSFDQIGFVCSIPSGGNSLRYINFGVNYHKHHDFNQLLNADNDLAAAGYASQTWQLADLCNSWGGVDNATPLADMAYSAYLLGEDGGEYTAYNAADNAYGKSRSGSNQAIDFNISTNIKDQFYLGLTVTGYNVRQKSYMAYGEDLLTADLADDGYYLMDNESKLTGNGVDVKFGFLVRPIQESNFKIGVTLATPTFYRLTYRNDLLLGSYTDSYGEVEPRGYYFDYDYNVRTPWKVGVSLGNTFFNRLAVGAEYEFADYSSCSVSYDDDYWDDWDWGHQTKDRELNKQLDNYLKGTHTLKFGAELMVTPNVYLRGGYNHVTSAIKKDAWLNHFINSASVDVATNTDYLNLGGINRYTAGIGLKFGKFYADATWLYQHQRGTLYAFNAPEDPAVPEINACPANRVSLNRSQVMLTMGYRF